MRRHARLRRADLGRQTRERHQRVHERRIARGPHPGVHPAHGRAHHQAQVVHAQPLGYEPVLRFDHVDVAVTGEFGAQAVTRFARSAVADVVGQDDEVLRGVERLPRAEQLAREARP